jgi:hypothetical protein
MARNNWDRVAREAKYERSVAALDAFLMSTLPNSSQEPTETDVSENSVARLPVGARRELRRVVVPSWQRFIQAIEAELDRIAHDRALVLATSREEQFAIAAVGTEERFVVAPMRDFRRESALFRERDYRLRRTAAFEGKWWMWASTGFATGPIAAELFWMCASRWSVSSPDDLWYGSPIVGASRRTARGDPQHPPQ